MTGEITAFFTDLSPVAIVYVDQEKVEAKKAEEAKKADEAAKQEETVKPTEEATTATTPATEATTSNSSSVSDGSVKTGDSNNAIVYVVILAGAAIAATGVCVARKKSSKTR